jgi:hypothetical protein
VVLRLSRTLLLLPLAFGCGSSNHDKYVQAAVGAGLAVAVTGVHRAVTKDCWARCSPGYLCNQESGLCERGECLPACEVGMHCTLDGAKVPYCARDAGFAPPHPAQANAPNPPVPLQSGPLQSLPQQY